MNGRVVLLLLLFLFLLSAPSAADALGPPYKAVDSCFEISNMDKFPDYLIVVINWVPRYNFRTYQNFQYQVIHPGECLPTWNISAPTPDSSIYAVRRADFNATAAETNWTYFIEDPHVHSSRLMELLEDPWVRESSNVTGIKNILFIESLNSTAFEVKKVKTIWLYTNVSPVTSKEITLPSNGSSDLHKPSAVPPGGYSDLVVPALILAGIAAIGIIAQILIRRKEK